MSVDSILKIKNNHLRLQTIITLSNMLIISLLCINILLASADRSKHNGHCDASKKICNNKKDSPDHDSHTKKLLFYDVNPPEGFNLRRDVYMRFAIMLSEARKRKEKLNWYLVLPPWHNMFHWKSETYRDPPKPWYMFFDVESLNSYVPVYEMHEVMENFGRYGLKIDTIYVLQNFDNPFENGVFEDKWSVVGPCKYTGHFWGYYEVTVNRVICVQFQGSISKLWDVIKLNPEDKHVMFAHGEIPLHDTYGTKPYWDCRKSMKFNQELIAGADLYIIKEFDCWQLKCTNYLALHWRRQDFLHANRSTSIKETVKQINLTIKDKSLNITKIFVASDGSQSEVEMLKDEFRDYGYTLHYYVPDLKKYFDGQLAIIEQIICSRSAYFVGTHESTFTYRIQEERELLGFDSDTTFNRLCPEVGECEEPSRWTIVH